MGGLYRFCSTTHSLRPANRAAAIMRSASDSESAMGFSTMTCFPASSASTATCA